MRGSNLSDSQSTLEWTFAQEWLLRYPHIDLYSEYRFDKKRRYRWDFCHLDSMVAIEIQGGVWMKKSGHSGGTGTIDDYKKYCFGTSLGWRIFPLADCMICEEYLDSIAATILANQR